MPEQPDIGYYVREPYGSRDRSEAVIYQRRVGNERAKLAALLLERWGLIASVPDGEDSAGRMRLRLMTTEELVQRACETANQFVQDCEQRGWYLDLPEPYQAEPAPWQVKRR